MHQSHCRHHPAPAKVLPVRVREDAFGPGLPRRDLFLSPDHAVFMERVLIPVKHLIDGCAVCQVPARQVTYFHIELRRHLVIIADGLPAESYLDTGDRLSFAQDGAALALHPVWGMAARDVSLVFEAFGYAPLCITGAEVERARAGLKTARSWDALHDSGVLRRNGYRLASAATPAPGHIVRPELGGNSATGSGETDHDAAD